MPDLRNRFADYLVYLALRVAAMFLHMFDWRSVYRLAGWVGDVWYRVDGRHRRRAVGHLRDSFPDWTESRLRCVARGSFRNLAYLGIEVLLTTRLITYWRWRRHVFLTDASDLFRRLLARDGGVIFIAGHFGGWEVVGYTMAALGFPGYAIARPLDNPYLNEYLMGVREKMGLKILDKAGAAAKIDPILRSGQYLGFIADQDAGRRGVFVNFFGRAASTYKAPALMAMEYDLPVAVGYGRRLDEQFRFEMGVERIIYPHEWTDKEDPVAWITQEYTAALEAIIRTAPEQYLWTYRRWKTRPRGERPRESAPGPQAIRAR
jgi:KDO2-lipid IV(A) lauroyltransferase